MKEQLCIAVEERHILLLRELAVEMGFKLRNRGGSISALMRFIADRYAKGETPFGSSTFEEHVFQTLLTIAESAQQEFHLGEDETVKILRKAAIRSFDGLQSQSLDNIILDIRAILFGEITA